MANSTMVLAGNAVIDRQSVCPHLERRVTVSSSGQTANTSSKRQSCTSSLLPIRERFGEQGFSRKTTEILMSSWKTGTKKQYSSCLQKWIQYCREREIDQFQPNINSVLEYFTYLFDLGLGYSTINTTRGALSAFGIKIDGILVGKSPLVIRYLRGVYNLRPSVPRYSCTWDVDKVLLVLRRLSPVKSLNLKELTLKLTMLIALTGAARTQSIHLLSVQNCVKLRSEFVFKYDGLLKQSRPNKREMFVHFKAYPPDRRLCIYTVVKEYLKRTRLFRDINCSKLLISYVAPHKEVSKDTISRWIRLIFVQAGIDTKIYGPHSVRSASSSKAHSNLVPLDIILKKAGWSREKTFAKFYKRDIETEDKFVSGVLGPLQKVTNK